MLFLSNPPYFPSPAVKISNKSYPLNWNTKTAFRRQFPGLKGSLVRDCFPLNRISISGVEKMPIGEDDSTLIVQFNSPFTAPTFFFPCNDDLLTSTIVVVGCALEVCPSLHVLYCRVFLTTPLQSGPVAFPHFVNSLVILPLSCAF